MIRIRVAACLLTLFVPGSLSYGQTQTTVRENTWLIETDYLMWWTRGSDVPALVSSSPPGTPRAQAGVLGTPGASVLFGGDTTDAGSRSGGRISALRALSESGETLLYFEGLYLGDDVQSGDFSAESTGLPILSRPFINAQSFAEDAQLVAFPQVLDGKITVDNYSELYGAGLGVQEVLLPMSSEMFVGGGYRFLSFRDQLRVREDLKSTDLASVVPLNTTFVVQDWFEANNDFHGGNVSLGMRTRRDAWNFAFTTSVALGGLTRRLAISGATDVTVPTQATVTTAGGLLAQPTNIGSYRSSTFVAIPELRAKFGRSLGEHLSLDIGYTFLLIPKTWRSSEQIDRVVNESQIGGGALSGPARPAVALAEHDLWIQGLSFGLTAIW